jgi:cyclase
VDQGRTVKGIRFLGLKDAGDPVELGARYSQEGADELVFLDITATHEKRKTVTELARNVARAINIPFTIGGGIASLKDADSVLNAGADKVTINSAAVRDPALIGQFASKFGSQCIVVAIDAKQSGPYWQVYLDGGRTPANRELFEWAREVSDRGAGEILFTSMNHDGTKDGYALEALARITKMVPIPVIASGGAGVKDHFADAFTIGNSDAALAASVFHFGEININELKKWLRKRNISVRL